MLPGQLLAPPAHTKQHPQSGPKHPSDCTNRSIVEPHIGIHEGAKQIAPLPLALASDLPRTIDIITKRSKHPTPQAPGSHPKRSPNHQPFPAIWAGSSTRNTQRPRQLQRFLPLVELHPVLGPLVPGARSQPARISACAQNFCLSSAPFL